MRVVPRGEARGENRSKKMVRVGSWTAAACRYDMRYTRNIVVRSISNSRIEGNYPLSMSN